MAKMTGLSDSGNNFDTTAAYVKVMKETEPIAMKNNPHIVDPPKELAPEGIE